MKFRELEKIIVSDGWKLANTVGSHFQYANSEKYGKVTILNHKGDIPKCLINLVRKQAELKKLQGGK